MLLMFPNFSAFSPGDICTIQVPYPHGRNGVQKYPQQPSPNKEQQLVLHNLTIMKFI